MSSADLPFFGKICQLISFPGEGEGRGIEKVAFIASINDKAGSYLFMGESLSKREEISQIVTGEVSRAFNFDRVKLPIPL